MGTYSPTVTIGASTPSLTDLVLGCPRWLDSLQIASATGSGAWGVAAHATWTVAGTWYPVDPPFPLTPDTADSFGSFTPGLPWVVQSTATHGLGIPVHVPFEIALITSAKGGSAPSLPINLDSPPAGVLGFRPNSGPTTYSLPADLPYTGTGFDLRGILNDNVGAYSDNTGTATLSLVFTGTCPAPTLSLDGASSGVHPVFDWTAVADALGYEVLRDGTLIQDVGNVLTFTDTIVPGAGPYAYTVRAYWHTIVSADSNTITYAIAPAAPVLTIQSGSACIGGQAPLTWTAPPGSIDHYTLARNANASYHTSAAGLPRTFLDVGLTTGTTYTYTVTATGANGLVSDLSVPLVVVPCLDYPPGLGWATGGKCEGAQVSLSWAMDPDLGQWLTADQITLNLYRNGGLTPYVTGLPGGRRSYLDASVTVATPTTYQITAVDIWGNESPKSPVVTITPCTPLTCQWVQVNQPTCGNWIQVNQPC